MCLDIHKTPVVFICTKGEIMKTNKKDFKSGFTLLELLVVVLIIGILASIALPQYEMAVTKAKVASILPIMRRWIDAYQEYYLQHGAYCVTDNSGDCTDVPDTDTLGVSWPSDWTCDEDYLNGGYCWNDYWECSSNEDEESMDSLIKCLHRFDNTDRFSLDLNQGITNPYGTRLCSAYGTKSHKLCKALGGTPKTDHIYSF